MQGLLRQLSFDARQVSGIGRTLRAALGPAALLCITGIAFLLNLPASLAAGDESEAVRWGETRNGLQLRAVPVLATMSEDDVDLSSPMPIFANRSEVAFAVELRNVSDKPLVILDTRYGNSFGEHKGKPNSDNYSQYLFEIDYFDKNGNKIAKPHVQIVDAHIILSGMLTAELAPKQFHRFLLRPKKWNPVLGQRLPAGEYSAVIRYRGMAARVAERISEYRPTSKTLEAWSGDAASPKAAFEIRPPQSDNGQRKSLTWGEPEKGLRAAVAFGTGRPICRHADRPDLQLHIQNVSQDPITICSPARLTDARLSARRIGGGSVNVGHTWYSGWTLSCRVTLLPGQTTTYFAGNVGIAETPVQAADFPHVTNRTIVTAPGNYRMQLEVNLPGMSLKDGKGKQLAPLDGDWEGKLTTGKSPLIVLGQGGAAKDKAETSE